MKQGWEYKKLGEVCYPKNKIQRATKCFDTSDKIFYIDISSIDNTIQKMTDVISVTFGDAPSRAQQKVEYGDIIVSTVRPNLKNIAIIDRYESNLVASSGFCVLRNTEHVERNYLFHYITSDLFTQHLMKLTTGANYPAVRDQDVRDSIIPIPPKSTQLAIVSELDKINELIRLKKEQLKDYDNLAQSIFYEMFGAPVENEKGWEVKKLGEVCTIERGSSPRPITAYITDSKDGINWIKIGDAQEGSKYITSTKEKIKPEGLKKSRFVHKGDFILSNSMSFGKPYILKIDGCIHDGWLVIHDNNNVFIKIYLYYLLASSIMYAKFSKLAVGGVVNNLNSSLVRKVDVSIPPLPLQHLFAQRIEQIEHQKSEVTKAITDLETLLASRMQHWFE